VQEQKWGPRSEILLSHLAGIVDVRWNHLQISLITMYHKLDKLGFALVEGEVVYEEPEVKNV